MSEETPKITTVKKEKDPKRVEMGKRLASISKKAREDKMRKQIESENKQKGDESWNINYGFVFGVVGVICALGSLYYTRKSDLREVKRLETIKEEPELEPVVIERKHGQKLDSL